MSEITKLTKIANTPRRYLSLERLKMKLGGRSRSSIYRDVAAGRLPKPMKRGARVYWLETDIDAALAKLREDNAEFE